MIAIGAYRIVVLGEGDQPPPPEVVAATTDTAQAVGVVLLLRAFASGAVALTGTEAIATGVPAFKPPEPKNAATTLMVMAGILAVLFVGHHLPGHELRGLSRSSEPQADRHRPGRARSSSANSIAFYLFQTFTALLLFLAANTSLRRVPAAGRRARRGRLLPAPVQPPRRPARLLDRDHPAGHHRGLAGRRLRRPDPRPHPALRGRRVHRLHHQPGRHDPALAADARSGLAAAPDHQRRRLRRDGHRRRRRRPASSSSTARGSCSCSSRSSSR